MNIIETLEQEEIARLGKTIPDFAPGDTVIVNVNVVEGERKRVQAYEGVVIAKRNRGLNSSFIVRKISQRRRRGAHVPDLFAADRLDRGQAPRRRAPRQALLPARPLGKSARIREKLAHGARKDARLGGEGGSRPPDRPATRPSSLGRHAAGAHGPTGPAGVLRRVRLSAPSATGLPSCAACGSDPARFPRRRRSWRTVRPAAARPVRGRRDVTQVPVDVHGLAWFASCCLAIAEPFRKIPLA